MATRRLQFFMTPDEFTPLVWHLAARHGLAIVMQWFGFGLPNEEIQHLERWAVAAQPGSLVMPHGALAERLYLTVDDPGLEARGLPQVEPGKWGWVQVDVPCIEGRYLLRGEITAKSDWYDPERRQIFENPESLSLFRKLAPPIRRHLQRPMWVYGLNSPALARRMHAVRDVGYSPGVVLWERSGGELMQRGVLNVRYTTQLATAPGGACPTE